VSGIQNSAERSNYGVRGTAGCKSDIIVNEHHLHFMDAAHQRSTFTLCFAVDRNCL
jgi:hypothetical protein